MLKSILTLISLMSPTGDMCDVYADGLIIDYDERAGIVVVDAASGDELKGTICVEPGATFTTSDPGIVLLIDQKAQPEGVIVSEGDLCVSVDGVNVCGCIDANGVGWSQDCPPGESCANCCPGNGGLWDRIKIHIWPWD